MTSRKSPERRLFVPLVGAAVLSVAAMVAMGVTELVRSHGTGSVLVFVATFAVATAVATVLVRRRRRAKSWPGLRTGERAAGGRPPSRP